MRLVAEHVPQRYHVVEAHRCSYRDRHFVHLVLRDGSSLVSVVLTRKAPGESLGRLAPKLELASLPVYGAATDRYQIAAFETRDHLAYVVSDLPATQNLELMADLAPAVSEFLARLEG